MNRLPELMSGPCSLCHLAYSQVMDLLPTMISTKKKHESMINNVMIRVWRFIVWQFYLILFRI